MATIGYEGRQVDDVVAALAANGIELLVDVRLTPISRKRGFSKRALAEALAAHGIGYEHVPGLGNPRDNRAGFRTGAAEAAKRRYLEHINNGSRTAYEHVLALAATKRLALLCFEADEQHCHRGCITRQAQQQNPDLVVLHL